MSADAVNNSKRRFLVASTSVVGAVGTVFVAVPFVKSWNPSAKALAAGAPVLADISKIEEGQMITVEWRGKPVYLYRRTDESVGLLETISDELKDPDNADEGQQPAYAKNVQRSRKPEIAVIEGVCTHLGCAPKYIPEVVPQPFQDNWVGGFFCPCHGSRFDLAGRVYKGSPAGKNLKVPPYSYVDENTILIGVDEENS